MNHYHFRNNSAQEKEWTYAVKINPSSHLIRWKCEECGRMACYPSGSFGLTLEGGVKFPDFLGCGEYPLLIVSERVIRVWKAAGIHSFEEYPVAVSNILGSGLLPSDSPDYSRIEISGECMIDFALSGGRITAVCGRCGEATIEPPVFPTFRIIEGSWDGRPLFRDRRYFPRVCFCTEKCLALSKNNGLTNCRFDLMH